MGNIPDEKIDRAAIEMKLEIPQDKVDNEAAALRSELLYGLQYQRLTSGNPYVDQDDLRRRLEDIPREALRQVKTQMVLERIAQDQGLTVTRQELEQETCAISQRQNIPMERILGQHRTIAEASAVESPIRQETIGFPAHFFARAHNFKPPGRACQPEADSPMRT